VAVAIRIFLGDASALFYDSDAFGMSDSFAMSKDSRRAIINQIVMAKSAKRERQIAIGPSPAIFYFTGKSEIITVQTRIGEVSVRHNLVYNFGTGIGVDDSISVDVAFDKGLSIDEAILHVKTILKFFDVIAGRPQTAEKIEIKIETQDNDGRGSPWLTVYWPMAPRRQMKPDKQDLYSMDILVKAVEEPEMFSRVLTNWLDRHEAWSDARVRFSECFSKQHTYSHDRLVAAANMFDILPASAVPPDIELSGEIKGAIDRSREAFRALSQSVERDSILSALGRLGKANLKQKIRYRANMLVSAVGDRLSEITLVTDEAVNCRNHYVHGTAPRFDYNSHGAMPLFFTDTLEFVFAISDMIEAGWDFKKWFKTPVAMRHPFAAYRYNYKRQLRELKLLLA
jgi:ApeA N-terminal domain 1